MTIMTHQPRIPTQRTSPETLEQLHPDQFAMGKQVAAGDVWGRMCCPGGFKTDEPVRSSEWSDARNDAYAAGYAAGVVEAEADYAAQGGYAGVTAAFGVEFAEGTADWLISLFDDAATLEEMWRVYR